MTVSPGTNNPLYSDGFSLNEIKETLGDDSNTILKNLLSNKMKELKDEINFKKNLIGEIENIKERLYLWMKYVLL